MTLTDQSDGVAQPSLVRLPSSDLQFTESRPPRRSRFEFIFSGVMVVLIFAMVAILLAVVFSDI
jgi:hypothetical protein